MNILHVDSSILGENSVSRLLSADLVSTLQRLHPDASVVYRDLTATPLKHFTFDGSDAATGDSVLSEFLAADILVIGAPMYNFTIPSQLKAWVDRWVVAGKTFRYGPNGAEGLAGGKKVFVGSARGGAYAETPQAHLDHQESYLTAILGYVGVTDVTFFRAENTARKELREASIAEARARIAALAS